MRVATVIGRTLVAEGIGRVFGVVGSGNFRVTAAMIDAGATFVPTRHEGGAASMADTYTRLSGEISAVSVHQGPGYTNALTGIVEARKSHTPLVIITPDTPDELSTSNFWIDQVATARALGVEVVEVTAADEAARMAARAVELARAKRTVVVLDVTTALLDQPAAQVNAERDVADQLAPVASESGRAPAGSESVGSGAADEESIDADAIGKLVELLKSAKRPVFIAGRGGIGSRSEILNLAERSGALVATSAVARGLFVGDPWNLDVSGGFATPLAVELIQDADVIVAWGASLNRWTSFGGKLLASATVAQVDDRREAFGLHHPVHLEVMGDVAQVAAMVAEKIEPAGAGYRTPEIANRIQEEGDWRLVPYEDTGTDRLIDPRTVTIALDKLLPADRVVTIDGGNFNCYPGMFFAQPAKFGFSVPLAFQSIGLSLASGIGAAFARPDVLSIVGVGDGGFMMSLVELDTACREEIPLLVLVYNDNAYGAEVHHFTDEPSANMVEFPETDIARIAASFGCESVTVRRTEDLEPVRDWLAGPRTRPMVVDARITSFPSWVLAHTFEGE